MSIIRVWRYQRGIQNPYIEEEQTTQWPKEKAKKDKQRSAKQTHKTTDRVTRTPLKSGVNSCAPEGWAVLAPVVLIYEWGKDREVFTTNGTYAVVICDTDMVICDTDIP